MDGFKILESLPNALGQDINGRSRLFSLFQPASSTRRLFKVLVSTLNKKSTAGRWWSGIMTLLIVYWLSALAGILAGILLIFIGSLIAGHSGLLGEILFCILLMLTSVGVSVYRDIAYGLPSNAFGLCTGGTEGELSTSPALVPWLHGMIQAAAGRSEGGVPLSFRDLWTAPGFPPPWLSPQSDAKLRSINLQMFTTNVTHGRPYHLPIEDQTSRLFFKREELAPYFPREVLDHLVKCSKPYTRHSSADPVPERVDKDLLELPCEDMPIVVAARLSLSFPLLFSAVPLWAIDYGSKSEERQLRRCWFSDGGISSNFPIHLFDSFLPMWPTFGVSLETRQPSYPEQATWLPPFHRSGRSDSWNHFDDKGKPIEKLGGFLLAIIASAREWNDNTLQRMPAVRDRVVRIRLRENEGGLNLNMPAELIRILSGYGREAAEDLRKKFLPSFHGYTQGDGWKEHRWVRFNILITTLRDRLVGFSTSAHLNHHAEPVPSQIRQSQATNPLSGPGETRLTRRQAQALENLLKAIEHLEQEFADNNEEQPYKPAPEPVIRIRPPL